MKTIFIITQCISLVIIFSLIIKRGKNKEVEIPFKEDSLYSVKVNPQNELIRISYLMDLSAFNYEKAYSIERFDSCRFYSNQIQNLSFQYKEIYFILYGKWAGKRIDSLSNN